MNGDSKSPIASSFKPRVVDNICPDKNALVIIQPEDMPDEKHRSHLTTNSQAVFHTSECEVEAARAQFAQSDWNCFAHGSESQKPFLQVVTNDGSIKSRTTFPAITHAAQEPQRRDA